MMEYNHILVRFGELTTKGKNRKTFIQKLFQNTKEALLRFEHLTYELTYDRLYILLNGEDQKEVTEALKHVFGILSFSLAIKVPTELEAIKEAASFLVEKTEGQTFKIDTKRNDKNFPMTSPEISRSVAGYIFHHTQKDLSVDVHHPDIRIRIELRQKDSYVMNDVIHGAGGYPVGIGGKALLMLSGGIDSPVAGYLTMKRGVEIECIHFASPPYTSDRAREKVLELVGKLNAYQPTIRVHVIPFTDLQLAIYEHTPESYAMTVMRRMMYRIAQRVAEQENCLAISNGESIGQVASQTLDSMKAINCVIDIPVIRPVVCMDKIEIMELARQIGTYDISIRPYEDCCTIFTPKQPATKPRREKCETYEQGWDFNQMVEDCVAARETLIIGLDAVDENADLF